jgi:hypothetical protein
MKAGGYNLKSGIRNLLIRSEINIINLNKII